MYECGKLKTFTTLIMAAIWYLSPKTLLVATLVIVEILFAVAHPISTSTVYFTMYKEINNSETEEFFSSRRSRDRPNIHGVLRKTSLIPLIQYSYQINHSQNKNQVRESTTEKQNIILPISPVLYGDLTIEESRSEQSQQGTNIGLRYNRGPQSADRIVFGDQIDYEQIRKSTGQTHQTPIAFPKDYDEIIFQSPKEENDRYTSHYISSKPSQAIPTPLPFLRPLKIGTSTTTSRSPFQTTAPARGREPGIEPSYVSQSNHPDVGILIPPGYVIKISHLNYNTTKDYFNPIVFFEEDSRGTLPENSESTNSNVHSTNYDKSPFTIIFPEEDSLNSSKDNSNKFEITGEKLQEWSQKLGDIKDFSLLIVPPIKSKCRNGSQLAHAGRCRQVITILRRRLRTKLLQVLNLD